jgi:TIR domain/Pentapeptide repeats (8 copies)
MANQEHLAILKQGVEVWNQWIKEHEEVQVDLSRANLSAANLNRAKLHGANLSKALLPFANLSKANLAGADLSGADLGGADLSGADLNKVTLWNTIFASVDLSTFKGLDACWHHGPSSLGVDTLLSSKNLPEVFLRGCGLPDNLICYLPTLFQVSAIQFYSCFLSHSTKDHLFAERLFNDLQGRGVRTWYAPEEMKGGEKLYDQIDSAIRLHDKLLLVLSQHSLKSEWVLTEIRRCRKSEEREGKRKLFPIRLVDMKTIQDWVCFDADSGKDLAVEVREFFLPDFSNWKDPDAYQKAFDRLLRNLKESAEQELSS